MEHEEMLVYENEKNMHVNANTIVPSPSINSYTSAYDDMNFLLVPSSPPV